jgi:hypothetical protein
MRLTKIIMPKISSFLGSAFITLVISGLIMQVNVYAASTGGCDNYIPTQGQTVTCSSSGAPSQMVFKRQRQLATITLQSTLELEQN